MNGPHDSTGRLKSDLQALIQNRQIAVIVGSGVSVATTGKAPTASWTGLLRAGIEHCKIMGRSDAWVKRQHEALQEAIDTGDLVELLNVANQVSQRLEAPAGEYIRWLDDCLNEQALPVKDPAVIQAIASLDAPILTTNYDDLIHRVTGLPAINWRQEHKILRYLRGDIRGVFHLHGHWDDPESVILAMPDYESVKNHQHTQAFMQAVGISKSLLFVGCGDGLDDPNFAAFLNWLGKVSKSDVYRNYRLALSSEVAELQAKHPAEQRVFVLSYGDEYSNLAPFLASLAPTVSKSARRPQDQTGLTAELDAYIHSLCQTHGELELIGLGAGLQIKLPIGEAYVPLKTSFRRTATGQLTDEFSRHEMSEREVQLHEVFTCSEAESKRGALLLGDPGAGKTTGARQFCWRLASGADAPERMGLPPGTLPVFVRLRNLKPEDVARDMKAFVAKETQVRPKGQPPIDVASAIWEFRGALLWIFDGLDEVVDQTARRSVCGWISNLLKDRQADRILVTSRYQGYEGKVDLGEDFLRFEVKQLEESQSEAFVHTWYRVVYGRLGLTRDAAETKASRLLRMLAEPAYRVGRIAELRSNPLLLTILCLVYHDDSSLPRSRARLYERSVPGFGSICLFHSPCTSGHCSTRQF